MSSLRIVKVMPFFWPATRFGGVVSQAELVCAELASRGHSVHVVTTDNGVPDEMPRGMWHRHHGYRTFYANTEPHHRVPPYWSPGMTPALRESLASADVCCLNVGLTLANRSAARTARRFGVPVVYNAEGALCPTRLQIRRWQKRLFVALVERPLLRGVAACQAVTEKEREDLVRCGAPHDRVHVIPNGVGAFEPGDGGAFRARHGLGDGPLVFFLGRLHRIKGVRRLVETFAATAPSGARLVLAGGDDDGTGREVQAFIDRHGLGDRIRRVDHLEDSERRDALAAADIFALFSETEGLPNAVLEALAAGLPCVLTSECNLPEVATDGAGFVHPRSAPKDLEESLSRLLGDAGLRAEMGAAARLLADRRFALTRVVGQLEELYRTVAR